MINQNSILSFLDSIQAPVEFVDNDHIIRYLNGKAEERYYLERGYADLAGKSLFDCHNEESKRRIVKLHERLEQGEDSITREDPHKLERFTLVAVRGDRHQLIGYYEIIEQMKET